MLKKLIFNKQENKYILIDEENIFFKKKGVFKLELIINIINVEITNNYFKLIYLCNDKIVENKYFSTIGNRIINTSYLTVLNTLNLTINLDLNANFDISPDINILKID